MIGALAGDIIGSVYEQRPIKTRDFPLFDPHCRFTDDSVLSVAVAAAILQGRPYADCLREFGQRYPHAGYGAAFARWLHSPEPQPYYSWGNGAAMRVSPVGFAFTDQDEVLREAEKSAAITHNHPEGIKGAQATALAIWLARTGHDKAHIRRQLAQRFGYNLDRRLDEIRPNYQFDVSCQGSVPEAIIAFLEADSVEDAVRNAVSLGGDSDTQACIAGGIAHAYYGSVPAPIRDKIKTLLTPALWDIVEQFCERYGCI